MQERIQKIIAAAGLASRRQAEAMILQGRVAVNGRVVQELGVRADAESDFIRVDGRRIRPEPREYWAVYKPQGMLSSVSDGFDRPLVTDLVTSGRRLYPAGRLDFQSEGLMILTNDGELTRLITKSGLIEKSYRVKVRGVPTERSLKMLRRGLRTGGEKLAPCGVKPLKRDENCWLEVRLRQGRKRQIRRMMEAIGHRVMRLRRVAIGPVQLDPLRPGQSRRLSAAELERLRSALLSGPSGRSSRG